VTALRLLIAGLQQVIVLNILNVGDHKPIRLGKEEGRGSVTSEGC
jgi:hypothetical protein